MSEAVYLQTGISKNSKTGKSSGNANKKLNDNKRTPNPITDFLNQEIIKNMIEKSVYIGEFRKKHKEHQFNYENRSVSKQLYFVKSTKNLDIKTINDNVKVFTSNSQKLIFLIDINYNLQEVSIETNSKKQISLINIFEKSSILLDVEYEDSKRHFYLLNTNLVFSLFSHMKYCKSKSSNHFEKLKNSKSRSINLNNYLVDKITDLNNMNLTEKRNLMSFDNTNDSLIINLTRWSDRLLIIDTISLTITHNIYVNPMQFYFICNPSINQAFLLLVSIIFKHQWSLFEFEEYKQIVKAINNDKSSLFYLRKLSSFIYGLQIKDISYVDMKGTLVNMDLIYESLIILQTNSTSSFFNFYIILERIEYYLIKLSFYSKLYEENVSYSENIYYFIIRCLKRNIDIKKSLESLDKNKNNFVSFSDINEIILLAPTGITKHEIDKLYDDLKYDEHNNIYYPFIFERDDYEIISLINKNKKLNSNDKFFGYFFKGFKNESELQSAKLPKRKYSDTNLYSFNKHSLEKMTENSSIDDKMSRLLGIYVEINKFIYIPNLNIFVFTLTSETKCSKLCLFKIKDSDDVNINKNKLKVDLFLLGFIETFSTFSPSILYYIPERNLIVSDCKKMNYENNYLFCFNFILEVEKSKTIFHLQNVFKSIHSKQNDGFQDILFIDIYKDIIDLFQVNKIWKIYKSKRIENVTKSDLKVFSFIPSSKLFFIRAEDEIFILNPKSVKNAMSIQYIYEKETENVYDFVCRSVCENKIEYTGDSVFNIVKHILIQKLYDSKIHTFYNLIKNCNFDYLLLFQKSSSRSLKLTKIEITNLTVKLNVKSFDENIEETELLEKIVQNQNQKILDEELNICLINKNKQDDELEMISKESYDLSKKTIKTFIINSNVSGEDKSLILKRTFASFDSLFKLLNDKTHKIKYITSILRNLNIINDPYILFKLIEKENWNKIDNEMKLNTKSEENLTCFFQDVGLNQMNFLLRIVNNKFEYLDIPKTKFINLISGKMSTLGDKINMRDINLNNDPFHQFNERVDHKAILKLFNSDVLCQNRKDVTYSKENIDNLEKIFNKPEAQLTTNFLNSTEHVDDEINPLDTAMTKLANKFIEKGIKPELSYNFFDIEKEDVIDKIQFISGLNLIGLHMNQIEINELFGAIDDNNSGCITAEEYYIFIEAKFNDFYKKITSKVKDINIDNPIRFDNDAFQRFKIEENNILLTKTKEDHNKEVCSKFVRMIEYFKIPLNHAFKLFDSNNNGVVFFNQFFEVYRKLGGKLSGNDVKIIYNIIDNNKKLYFNKFDFDQALRIIYQNINKKSFDNNLEEINIKDYIKTDMSNVYIMDNFDKLKIIFYIMKKLNEFIKKNNIKRENLFYEIASRNSTQIKNVEYLPLNKILSFIKNEIYQEISKFEIDLFRFYVDFDNVKLIFREEFDKIITGNLDNFFNTIDVNSSIETSLRENKSVILASINKKTNSMSEQKLLNNIVLSKNFYLILRTVQEKFKATGLRFDEIFNELDVHKKGFVTLTTLIDVMPNKFNIFLTINQSIDYFNFMDTNNDGIINYDKFKNFFETNYSCMIFEEKYYNLSFFIENFTNNTLTFLNKSKIDIRNVFEYFDSSKGFLYVDDIIKFFKDVVELRMGQQEIKLLFDYLFNDKFVKVISLRKFLLLLDLLGINFKLFTNSSQINECVDMNLFELLKILYELGLDNIYNLNLFFSESDTNKDGFLTVKEFSALLSKLHIEKNKILSLVYRFNEKNYDNLISISTLTLVIKYFQDIYKTKIIMKYNELNNNKISELFVYGLNLMDIYHQSSNLKLIYKDYENLLYKGFYSGLILYSKIFENENLQNKLLLMKRRLNDQLCYMAQQCNHHLKKKFLSSISNEYDSEHRICDYQNLDIPQIEISISDLKDKQIFRKISNLGESFRIYHSNLKSHLSVFKFKRSDLVKIVSSDGQSLINQIEYSLKFYHYLETTEASHQLERFKGKYLNYFFKNYGLMVNNITSNKKGDQDIYILDETVNLEEYLCLEDAIKNNGGLLSVPDLFNTDMVFHMIRFWGKQILKVFVLLHRLNICFKYINLSDIYISKDGMRIKFKKNMLLSHFNSSGKIYSGPNLENILIFYENSLVFDENERNVKLGYDEYDDPFIAPEVLFNENKVYSQKIDSFLFGTILYYILFGVPPESVIRQVKEWCNNQTTFNFKKIKFPQNIVAKNFNYSPFKYAFLRGEDTSYKNFIESIRINSFSAIIPRSHLDDKETSKNFNGIGIIFDMINSCLSLDENERPNLNDLIESNLFHIEKSEKQLIMKFAQNTLKYFSPETIMLKQILIPLREISCKVMNNPEEINKFENFLYFTIKKLDSFVFGKEYNTGEEESQKINTTTDININDNINKKVFNQDIVKFNKNNRQMVQAIIENKVFDIVIFLVLRHFNSNLQSFKEEFEKESYENFKSTDKKLILELKKQKFMYMKGEMEKKCGKLLKQFIDFLQKCVSHMTSYDHIISCYVENIIEYIIKLFIGEDYKLISLQINSFGTTKKEKIKKYCYYRTFFRNEQKLGEDFVEDEADKYWSILNNNIELCERPSFWSPELCLMVDTLYRDSLTEIADKVYKYHVIGNYFHLCSDKTIENNPIVNNELQQFFQNSNHVFTQNLSSTYVNEILSLSECAISLNQDISTAKNTSSRKSALVYINSIFRNKNFDKIKACFDFKIQHLIVKFLYSKNNSLLTECLQIFNEFSICLVDLGELSWLFGNNYKKILEKTTHNKSEVIEFSPSDEQKENSDNFSLIQFLNSSLKSPTSSYILKFTEKFFGNKRNPSITYVKEIAYSFSNSIYLRPILRILQKSEANMRVRTICLEILFNITLSNDERLISNLNTTLCNFYEAIARILNTPVEDSHVSSNFENILKNIIYILIEIQNPYVKSQMFKSLEMQKYMRENNLDFQDRIDFEELYLSFINLRNIISFSDHIEKINFLLNSFKCYIQHFYGYGDKETKTKVEKIISTIIHIFNIEWKEGLKMTQKNCLIFNIVKLFEWMCKKKYHSLLFDSKESISVIILFMTKIREFYELVEIEENIIIDIKNKEYVEKPLSTTSVLQKIYHLIALKLQYIILFLFSLNDDNYNKLLVKCKFGILIGELMKIQYKLLGEIFDKKKNDIQLLNNYIQENKIRSEFIDYILNSKNIELKIQFLDTNFIEYMVSQLMGDFRRFYTSFKRLSVEFLVFKESYPIRMEVMAFIHMILKKASFNGNSFIYDETIKNIKKYYLIQKELNIIKNTIKGKKVHSVFLFLSVILNNKNQDLLTILEQENANEYLSYAMQKDAKLLVLYPTIIDYLEKKI